MSPERVCSKKTHKIVGIQTSKTISYSTIIPWPTIIEDRQTHNADHPESLRWVTFHISQLTSALERERDKKKECISIMDSARYCCVNIKKKNDFFYEMMESDTFINIYIFLILFDYRWRWVLKLIRNVIVIKHLSSIYTQTFCVHMCLYSSHTNNCLTGNAKLRLFI